MRGLLCLLIQKNLLKITKKFSFCLVFFLFLSIGSLHAQQARVTLNYKNTDIKQILKDIESKTDYSFFYNDADIESLPGIDVQVNNEPLDAVLKRILPDFSYRLEKKRIILIPNKTGKQNADAAVQQGRTITGTVTDKQGEALIGVSVKLQNSPTVGTVTDINGKYTLHSIPDQGNLVFSYIGYAEQVLPVKGKSTLDVIMGEDFEVLDEVVVVGYGVQKKANLSGAVGSVSSKTLKDRPVTNIGQALQGAVANLNITPSSGQANSIPKFNIRGTGTLTTEKDNNKVTLDDPLIVIDGLVSSVETLNNMNPNDIESTSVLKDAASAAIYGSRAAFGVILVTTKKGMGDRVNVNYNNNFSFRKLSRTLDLVTDPATIVDMKNVYGYPWYTLYDENQVAYAKRRSEDPSLSPYLENPDGTWSYFGATDWLSETYKDAGFSTTHSIDVSGASKILSYYFSANYFFQDGMLNYGNDKYNRYNLRSKMDFKVTDWWTIGNNTSYSTNDYDRPNYLGEDYYWGVMRTSPMTVPRNPDGTWTDTGASLLGRLQEGGRYKSLTSTFTTQLTTKIDLFKDIWSINGSFALNRYENSSNNATLPVSYHLGPEMPILYYDEITSASERTSHSDNITFDVYSTFNKTFNDKHFVNVVAGFNQEEYKYKYLYASRKELISGSLPDPGLATGDMTINTTKYSYALRGAFYRLNYIYDNKYIFETNGRYDGSSRFPKDDRFAFNPSASIAWVASQENFFESIRDAISHLKVRMSYGSLGNQITQSHYPYIATMSHGKLSTILDGVQPVYVGAPGLVSNSLTWEKVITKNLGLDINFLNNRLTTTFDIYQRDTKDMLTTGRTLPSVLGTGVPKENAADLRTKGWDLTVSWNDRLNLAGKPLSYNFNFILSDNKTKVTKFDNPTGSLSDHFVGEELGTIWGFKTLGYFTSEEDVKNHADQSLIASYPGTFDIEPGDLKFEDRDGDGIIYWGKWTKDDMGDVYKIGNTTPRYNFSLSGGADWNGFDFSFFLQGVGKRDYYPGSSDLFFWGINAQPWSNVTKSNMDYWTPENPNAYFPRRKAYVAYQDWKEATAPQTKYLQNAAYMRLKNLTVGYTLPRQLTEKINVSRLRIYFSGENLCEISGLDKNYKVDPEGLGGQMYPFQRSFSFGLNVTF